MNKTVLSIASSLLIAGAASPAFGQEVIYQYEEPLYYNGDVDNDSIPNWQDPYDDRFDAAGNPVRFEVGEFLPPEAYGNSTRVYFNLYGLPPPPAGATWNRLGNNFYLVSNRDGHILDAVYNLRDY